MPTSILHTEQKHLDRTALPIRKKLQKTEIELSEMMTKYEEGIKKVAKESLSLDEKLEDLGDLNKMMKSQAYNYKKNVVLKRLKDQVSKPYFAKIEFHEQGFENANNYYIGRFANYDEEDSIYHVVDWRAPVASVYYNNNEPKDKVTYDVTISDNTRIIQGDLKTRINFDIDNTKIISIYDNSLRIDLLKLRISQKSGGKLTDIIETIQDTQNKIIRSDPIRTCIVQGTAGSGKTTIAVHRLSYILYTYKNIIKERDTLLISSSRVLIHYVSSTLPELDVLSVDRFTIEDIFSKALVDNDFVIYTESILSYKRQNSEIMNSWDFLNFLNVYCNKLKSAIIDDLETEKFFDKLNLKSYFSRNFNTPIFDILHYMYENLENKHFILKADLNKGNFTVEDEVDNLNEALYTLKQLFKEYTLKKIYSQVLVEYSVEKSLNLNVNSQEYDIDDLSALFILGKLLFASSYKNKIYKQIIIDEAQDMGILNYMAIKMLGEKSGFTILGDLNQSINNNGCITSWEDIENIFGKETIDFFEIKVSYRTTKQVISFAKKILQNFANNKYLPQSFEREGSEPQLLKFNSKIDILQKIAAEILQKRNSGDLRAVAIIECDKSKFEESKNILIKIITDLEPVYSSFEDFSDTAVYLITADLVKGLEFDTVYIIDPNENIYEKSIVNSKKLFVLTTRAINTLKVYYYNTLTPLIN